MWEELIQSIARFADAQPGDSPYRTLIPGLAVLRSRQERQPAPVFFRPALCIVVQGAKWALFGDRRLDYRAGQALVINVAVPMMGRVVEASPDKPFLGLILEFDPAVMAEVWQSLNRPAADAASSVLVVDVDGPLADCALRMMRLLERPDAIPALFPLIQREISYWLLTGPHGAEIARLALAKERTRSVIESLHTLRDTFAQTVRIEELAKAAAMSPSSFHKQFKALTAMTPLQYQKQLRLLEARRLMIAEGANAETAAFRVGYESASQFSRDYSRIFGYPPKRDVTALRAKAG
jgi:AraC-like DNA-binding protein